MPRPLAFTVSWRLGPSWRKTIFADRGPASVGAKVAANFSDDAGGTTALGGQTLTEASLEEAELMVRSPPPALVTVIESTLVEPTNRSPKLMVVGEAANVPPTPVPVTLTESSTPECKKMICVGMDPWSVGANVT